MSISGESPEAIKPPQPLPAEDYNGEHAKEGLSFVEHPLKHGTLSPIGLRAIKTYQAACSLFVELDPNNDDWFEALSHFILTMRGYETSFHNFSPALQVSRENGSSLEKIIIILLRARWLRCTMTT